MFTKPNGWVNTSDVGDKKILMSPLHNGSTMYNPVQN